MKINKRTKEGWLKNRVENKSKEFCDKCGKRLWIAPHGGVYCNTQNCGDK